MKSAVQSAVPSSEEFVPSAAPGYLVSASGFVKVSGHNRVATRGTGKGDGYLRVTGTDGKNYRVSRLVAMAHIGPPPFPGAVINHRNRNKADNRVENLEWTSQSLNIALPRPCHSRGIRTTSSGKFLVSIAPPVHSSFVKPLVVVVATRKLAEAIYSAAHVLKFGITPEAATLCVSAATQAKHKFEFIRWVLLRIQAVNAARHDRAAARASAKAILEAA